MASRADIDHQDRGRTGAEPARDAGGADDTAGGAPGLSGASAPAPASASATGTGRGVRPVMSWRGRAAVLLVTVVGVFVVLFTNQWLTERFTETTRNRAAVRQALYAGNVLSELRRNSIVPLLLSR